MADGIPVTAAVRSGGLTPSDPGVALELLAFNAFVQRVGEQTGHQFLLPRGSLERGGVGPFSRGLVRYPRARQSWFASPRAGSLLSSEAEAGAAVEVPVEKPRVKRRLFRGFERGSNGLYYGAGSWPEQGLGLFEFFPFLQTRRRPQAFMDPIA